MMEQLIMQPTLTVSEKLSNENDELKIADTENATLNNTAKLLALVEDVEFFHDEQKQAHASFKNNNHTETWLVESNRFREWLVNQFWKEYQMTVGESSLQTAILTMKGKAIFEGKCCEVFMRVGTKAETVYINIGDDNWGVIEVTKNGWRVLNTSPVKFRGTQNMRSLPLPETNGDIELLWRHINIPKSQRLLVLAWMLDYFISNTPFPLLVLSGLQGSGKSSTQEILRNFIDPNAANLRNAPKNDDDIVVAAANNYLVSFNNVSRLTISNQDDLCCLSTGGGFAKRRLYTTDEESVVDIKRPTVINGIGDLVTRQDLIDRSIIIELPIINEKNRKTEYELAKEFDCDKQKIFGALLDILSKVLKTLPTIQLETKPRMASFAVLGAALEKAMSLPSGSFAQEYKNNYHENILSAIENNPVAVALVKFMRDEKEYRCSYSDLLVKLSNYPYRPDSSIDFPKSAKGLSNFLKRHAPALELISIKISFEKRTKDGYFITIINQGEN